MKQLAVLVALALAVVSTAVVFACGGCQYVPVEVPGPVDPGTPTLPPVDPPVDPPAPPQPPQPPPASIKEALEGVEAGMSPAEVGAIMGSAPIPVPHGSESPYVVRWYFKIDGVEHYAWVRFSIQNRAEDKGIATVMEAGD